MVKHDQQKSRNTYILGWREYFLFKNNTHLSFPSIDNDVNYCPSKRKNDVNYGANVCVKESMCMLKERNTWVQEVGIENCWCKK